MLTAYVVCFWVGLVLTVLLAVLGITGDLGQWHFGGHVAEIHADAGTGSGDTGGPSILNAYTILAFVTGFGGVGYVLTTTGTFSGVLVLICAVLVGLFVSWIIFMLLWRLFLHGQRFMKQEDYDLVGMFGTLSVGIPAGGIGEMKYTLDDTIRSIGVRSESGQSMEKGMEVVILGVDRGIATVVAYDAHVHAVGRNEHGANQEGIE